MFKISIILYWPEVKDQDKFGHPNSSLKSPKEEDIADKGQSKPDPVGKYISVIINILKLKIASYLDFYTKWKLKRYENFTET